MIKLSRIPGYDVNFKRLLVAAVTWWGGHCLNVCSERGERGGAFVWFGDKSEIWADNTLNTPEPIQWHSNNTPSLLKTSQK